MAASSGTVYRALWEEKAQPPTAGAPGPAGLERSQAPAEKQNRCFQQDEFSCAPSHVLITTFGREEGVKILLQWQAIKWQPSDLQNVGGKP